MKDKLRKEYQRGLNRLIKKANRIIRDDNLWQGRFYILQRENRWFRYEDDSGGNLNSHIRVYDHKTGYYKDYIFTYVKFLKSMYWRMSWDVLNKFIVEDLDVWSIEDRKELCARKDDYRNVPYMQNDNREDNWYLSYKEWNNEG